MKKEQKFTVTKEEIQRVYETLGDMEVMFSRDRIFTGTPVEEETKCFKCFGEGCVYCRTLKQKKCGCWSKDACSNCHHPQEKKEECLCKCTEINCPLEHNFSQPPQSIKEIDLTLFNGIRQGGNVKLENPDLRLVAEKVNELIRKVK